MISSIPMTRSKPIDLRSPSPLPSFSPSSASSTSSFLSTNSTESCTDTCCPPPPKSPSHPPPIQSLPSSQFYSTLIIGAGPSSLAVAARLAEPHPSALYTNLEHARLPHLRRSNHTQGGGKTQRKDVLRASNDVIGVGGKVKVLDKTSSGWMGKWKNYFEGLRIENLRSPMWFHPSPAEVDGLVGFAQREGREGERVVIEGVVGKELSKHARKSGGGKRKNLINERERADYHRPSASLFNDFVDDQIISPYSLDQSISHVNVTSVEYSSIHIVGEGIQRGFVVEGINEDGEVERYGAKNVVVAVGPSGRPNIPASILCQEEGGAGDEGGESTPSSTKVEGAGWCHSSAFGASRFEFLTPRLRSKIQRGEPTTILVIGGGLTAAQLTSLSLSLGITQVLQLIRSHLRVSHFDFPLSYLSKYASPESMRFNLETSRSERLKILQEARGGGSVNPEFYTILKDHQTSGRLDLRNQTELVGSSWDTEKEVWDLRIKTKGKEEERVEDVDYIICATGSTLDFEQLGFLEGIRRDYPMEMVRGYPRITQDLQWNDELPLFVVGAFAALELGPDSSNLGGTRYGAERVVQRISVLQALERARTGELEEEESEEERVIGWEENFFDQLVLDEDM